MDKTELLIEANKRGLLTGDKKTAFDEAVRRGIISVPDTQREPEQAQGKSLISTVMGGGSLADKLSGVGDIVVDTAGEVAKGAVSVAGGVGKQLLYDTPESITSVFGLAPSPVSKWFQNKADEFDKASKDLGLPKGAVHLGEAVGTGISTGNFATGIGKIIGGRALEGAIATAKSGFKGKIKQTVARYLNEAAKSPLKIAAVEGAIAGAADASAQAAEGVTSAFTDNENAIGVAGLASAIIGGSSAGVSLYAKHLPGLMLEKQNTAQKKLQEYMTERYTPEQLATMKVDAERMSKEGVNMTLDKIIGDGRIARTRTRLEKMDTSVEKEYASSVEEIKDLFKTRILAMTDKSIPPEEMSAILSEVDVGLAGKMNELRTSVTNKLGEETAAEANAALHEVFSSAIEKSKVHIDDLYDVVDMTKEIDTELSMIVRNGISSALHTEAKDKGVIPISVRAGAKLLSKELAESKENKTIITSGGHVGGKLPTRTRTIIDNVPLPKATLGGLKDIRSMLSDRAMTAEANGRLNEAWRLRQMTGSITKAFESMDNGEPFRVANDAYKTMSELKGLNSVLPFFSKRVSGESRQFPENFKALILGPSAEHDSKVAIGFANGKLGEVSGMTEDKLREGARGVLLSLIKASSAGGDVKPANVLKVIEKRKGILDVFGLTDDFNDIHRIAEEANVLELSRKGLSDTSLAAYGFTGNLGHLNRSVKDMTFFEDLKRVPLKERGPIIDAARESLILDKYGQIRPHKELMDELRTFGVRLGMKKDYIARLDKISDKIDDVPLGEDIQSLEDFVRTPRDLGNAGLNLLFEKLRRPASRIALGLRFTGETLRSGQVKRDLRAAIMTPEGSKRALDMAAKDPSSWGLIKWALRVKSVNAAEGN